MNKNTKFPRQKDRKGGNKKAHDKKTQWTAPKEGKYGNQKNKLRQTVGTDQASRCKSIMMR